MAKSTLIVQRHGATVRADRVKQGEIVLMSDVVIRDMPGKPNKVYEKWFAIMRTSEPAKDNYVPFVVVTGCWRHQPGKILGIRPGEIFRRPRSAHLMTNL